VDDLDRLRLGLPTFETAGGNSGWNVRSHQLSAFASCARQLGVDVEIVLRAASTGKLAALIEKRGGTTTTRRNLRRRHLARMDQLHRREVLMAKLVPPWS
jgi:hypothetical protein